MRNQWSSAGASDGWAPTARRGTASSPLLRQQLPRLIISIVDDIQVRAIEQDIGCLRHAATGSNAHRVHLSVRVCRVQDGQRGVPPVRNVHVLPVERHRLGCVANRHGIDNRIIRRADDEDFFGLTSR